MSFLFRSSSIALLLFGCFFNQGKDKAPIAPVAVPSPASPQKLITLNCDQHCTETEREKLKKVEAKVNETLASKCFSDYITDPARKMNMADGKSAQEIIKIMRTPAVMTVNYYSSIKFWVLGYEIKGEPIVHLNRGAIIYHKFNICDEASVVIHETSHAKGFSHRGNTPDEYNQDTVPYLLNRAFDTGPSNGGCCKTLLN